MLLPDDPRELVYGQYIENEEGVWEVVGHQEDSGLPIIEKREDVPEYRTEKIYDDREDSGRISGYVGRVIGHDEVHDFYFGDGAPVGSARPKIPADKAVVTLGGKTAPRIERWLTKLTAGVFGYAIEPADTTWVVIDRDDAADLSPGDCVSYPASKVRSSIDASEGQNDG
ncbi:hypothetical protein [Halosimplex carlsbadense]|uniref:hypothetical protein n=1 Tax=Halosimplex carlsbadense TaxID=171164 RepID=UPI0012694AE0|nr:hypothetical protein [Halosimplex carlsbadense]